VSEGRCGGRGEWVPWIGVEERFPPQRRWGGGFSPWREKRSYRNLLEKVSSPV
jgi:hypothetical protein